MLTLNWIEIQHQLGAELHMTIYDNQLNHDPTQEDSVWFLTNGTYGVSYNASAPFAAMTSTEFGDNGALKIDYDSASVGTDVLLNQDTTDCDRGIAAGTLTVNSGAVAQAEERVADSVVTTALLKLVQTLESSQIW